MQIGAVIIAAGLSSRMGEFKPMLPIGNTTVIRKIIATLQEAEVDRIVVVTGYRGEQLKEHVDDMNVTCVHNARFAQSQMFDSARLGFLEIHGLCDKVLFMPVDMPLFQADTVLRLVQSGSDLICPTWQGKRGHPILIADALLDPILKFNGDFGLHGAFLHCGKQMEFLSVDDMGVIYDMDTQRDYRKICIMYEEQEAES